MRDAIKARDWYAVGTVFGIFRFDNPGGDDQIARAWGESLSCQTLFGVDVATGHAFRPIPVKQTPGYYPAETVIDYLRGLFRQHGKPRVGVVISDSAYKSLANLLADGEIRDRVAFLEGCEMDFPGMPLEEAEKIERWLAEQGLRTEWEEARLYEGCAAPALA